MTYKEYLFASSVDSLILNESFNYPGKVSFLDLLLEAPIDDSTVKKIIADKKRVSIYYQGDKQSPKGWYSVEAVKVKDQGGDKYLLTYVHPKEGGEPKLTYFIQDRIVNWNVLGKKDATAAKDYGKKIFKYFSDPKVPVEAKKKYQSKLRKVGGKVVKWATTGLLATSLLAGLAAKNFASNNLHGKGLYNFLTLKSDTMTEKDLKSKEIDALQDMVKYGLKHPKQFIRNGSMDLYNIANALNKSTPDGEKIDFRDKELGVKQTDLKSEYTKIAMTFGNARVKKAGDNYVIEDIYDFNNFYEHPEDYTLKNVPKTVGAAFKNLGDGNYVQGIEKLASYYEKLGYKGYPVKITIPSTDNSSTTKPVK